MFCAVAGAPPPEGVDELPPLVLAAFAAPLLEPLPLELLQLELPHPASTAATATLANSPALLIRRDFIPMRAIGPSPLLCENAFARVLGVTTRRHHIIGYVQCIINSLLAF